MKKVIFIIAIVASTCVQVSFAQDSTKQDQLSLLLTDYYNIKNALVAGDVVSASANAKAFLQKANTIDYKVISEGNVHALSGSAGKIAEAENIQQQREYFALFSINMTAVAKAIKLTDRPIYQLYCPMKKAYWLSSEKEVRNPYFGSSMLTCGEVTGTIQ
jgi:hypothetical protein